MTDYARFKPKRSAKRWLVGAPEYVVACYDNGGKTADRYTLLFGGSLWTPSYVKGNAECGIDPRLIQGLQMSESPSSPQGVSIWGDCLRGPHLGKKIPWSALPAHIQEHTKMRAESD